MRDARGAEVNAGDTVVYFVRGGSTMDYKAGTVTEIVSKREYWAPNGVIDAAKVEIIDEGFSWSDHKKPRTVTGKNLVVVTGLPEVKAE